MRLAEDYHVQPKALLGSVQRTHVFTHIVWNMTGYAIACENPDAQFTWLTMEEIRDGAALPTAFRMFRDTD